MSRLFGVLRRLVADLAGWGPLRRMRRLPEHRQREVLDEHWRNG